MPSIDAHRLTAAANQRLIDALIPNIGNYAPWIAVVAFYKALHAVELLFQLDPKSANPSGTAHHDDRDYALRDNRYRAIHRHYFPLKQASMVARYLEVAGREYDNCDEFMKLDQV